MRSFNLHFLAADRIFYEGPCDSIVVPVTDGFLGILAGHANMMGAVVPGEVHMKIDDYEKYLPDEKEIDPKTIKNREDGTVDVSVSAGLVKVENGEVTILVDSALLPHEIDVQRARRAEAKAQEELLHSRNVMEYRAAESALSRAIARINSKHRHFE